MYNVKKKGWLIKMEDVKMTISDEVIFSKLDNIFKNLKQTQKLQQLATDNGLDIKNSINLTDDTIDNVITSVIALLIAQQNHDPRYKELVLKGTQKRSLKTEIINNYKNQANQYRNKFYAYNTTAIDDKDIDI